MSKSQRAFVGAAVTSEEGGFAVAGSARPFKPLRGMVSREREWAFERNRREMRFTILCCLLAILVMVL